jgi:Spy/CpxP family protein refolding chaperone
MKGRDWWTTLFCLVALVLVSGFIGVLIGRRYTQAEFQVRSDPSRWNETAMHDLEKALKPTPEQRQKIQEHLDVAVAELREVRADTIRRSTEIVVRLVGQVEKVLTPEQRVGFERLKKARQNDLADLEVLNVEPRKN